MNIEDRLSEALKGEVGDANPSPGLADRIALHVAVTRRPAIRLNPRIGFGMAAILVVAVALVPIAASLRSNGGPAGPATGGPSGAIGVNGELAHFHRDGLAFDYPASWHASVSGFNMHYSTILDFVGSGSGSATCNAVTPGPGEDFISGSECGQTLDYGPGQVIVSISRQYGPPMVSPIDPTDTSALQAGQKYVTVGGLPAMFFDDGGTQLSWIMSVPGQVGQRYVIQADMKAPGIDVMRAQVQAMVAGLRFDPAPAVLNPANGPRVAATGLGQLAAKDASYDCFPTIPGTSAESTVTEFPGYSALQKPLPVTCATEIRPDVLGLWEMTLTESWTAAADRSAGSLTTTVWLDPDGTPGMTGGGPAPSEIPYWP
jgi:hypothetical protein